MQKIWNYVDFVDTVHILDRKWQSKKQVEDMKFILLKCQWFFFIGFGAADMHIHYSWTSDPYDVRCQYVYIVDTVESSPCKAMSRQLSVNVSSSYVIKHL